MQDIWREQLDRKRPGQIDRFVHRFQDTVGRGGYAENREKRNIGERLAEVSGGRVLFWWAEDAESGNLTSELTELVARQE